MYGCVLDKMYVAVKGHGSFFGEEKLSVSEHDGKFIMEVFTHLAMCGEIARKLSKKLKTALHTRFRA